MRYITIYRKKQLRARKLQFFVRCDNKVVASVRAGKSVGIWLNEDSHNIQIWCHNPIKVNKKSYVYDTNGNQISKNFVISKGNVSYNLLVKKSFFTLALKQIEEE